MGGGQHCFDQFDLYPYASVTSPTKRSGKSLLLDVLGLVVADPWPVVQPSPAVTFRKIECDAPTMLLDEVDTVFGGKRDFEELRGILNAGYRRGAKVARVAGEKNRRLEEFAVFCPKVLAGIGRLPDTIADRSIPIRLKRRTPGEKVERFRWRHARADAESICDALAQAVVDVAPTGVWMEELNDRAADSWEPLLAVAAAAGGDWPERGRAAALALSGRFDADDESIGVQLLADCRDVFGDHDRMFTDSLITLLRDRNGLWDEGYRGKPLSPHRPARMLRGFDVYPAGTIRIGAVTAKGYMASAFEDAWRRYLPPPVGSDSHIVTSAAATGAAGVTLPLADSSQVTQASQPSPNGHRPGDVVTVGGRWEGDLDHCHVCGHDVQQFSANGTPWCEACLVNPFPAVKR